MLQSPAPGMHRQIHPQRVLRAATMRNLGGQNYSPSVVHLFHAHSKQCAQLDMVLEQLAQKYRGTRFLRADGIAVIQVDSKVCEYLELRIDDVPSLITFVDGKMKLDFLFPKRRFPLKFGFFLDSQSIFLVFGMVP